MWTTRGLHVDYMWTTYGLRKVCAVLEKHLDTTHTTTMSRNPGRGPGRSTTGRGRITGRAVVGGGRGGGQTDGRGAVAATPVNVYLPEDIAACHIRKEKKEANNMASPYSQDRLILLSNPSTGAIARLVLHRSSIFYIQELKFEMKTDRNKTDDDIVFDHK